jgi:hypothetical protein
LFKYNLTINLFVGSIVVLGKTISTLTSEGITALTHPISTTLDVIVGPIGVPELLANCISTYASISSLLAGFK